MELASEDLALSLKGQEVKGKALVSFLKKLASYERLIEWFERRRKETQVLRFLLKEGTNKAVLKDKALFRELLKKMKAEVPDIAIGELYPDEEHGGFGVLITRQNYKVALEEKLLLSPEYRELEALHGTIRDLGTCSLYGDNKGRAA